MPVLLSALHPRGFTIRNRPLGRSRARTRRCARPSTLGMTAVGGAGIGFSARWGCCWFAGLLAITGHGWAAFCTKRSPAQLRARSGAAVVILTGRRVDSGGHWGEASMTAKAIPRHASAPDRQRWVPQPREGRLPRVWAQAVARPGRPGRPDGRMPADPLAGPVAITQRAVAGDRSRGPTAWCEMAACISRYDDPAALGEADIRARALGAGWRHDTAGRLICPYCQRRRPGSRAASPVAGRTARPLAGPASRPVIRGLAGSAPCG
jgi:hypothetical protein